MLCVLPPAPPFAVPVLAVALRLGVGSVGALGSRPPPAARLARLRAAGLPAAALRRLSRPLGLALGARPPAAPAVSL
ncbi:XdhC family protein, partial [Mycobacterium tuberculosis]|uniref:XdhC family protein n=1 Tax=Mycobacterium tuberculosis TaxID=1773 RepID=UPI0030101915